MYTYDDVMAFVKEEDVQFIRLAFCDVLGNPKNIAIMPDELSRAFADGISFDASAIKGFLNEVKSDLFLKPDPSTLSILPWRPSNGRVVRMFADVMYPDGTRYEKDSRSLLKKAVADAGANGFSINIGTECEFYLFRTDENGKATDIPFDNASYMDIAPEDKGENVRREICLTLREMGIMPESSHHEEGPGQNEIDFHYSDALTAADNTLTFKTVVRTIAMRNGLYADFSPKPIPGQSGNGMHINLSVDSANGQDVTMMFMAGILKHIAGISLFMNPCEASYRRLGEKKAPRYITWSPENRSQLIRIPAASGKYKRIELRSPDPQANPYLAYALLIYAGLDGITNKLVPPYPTNLNLFTAPPGVTDLLPKLPLSLAEAVKAAKGSTLVSKHIPEEILKQFI